MADKPKQSRGEDDALSSLNMAIDELNRINEAASLTPAKTAFTSAGVLLATIRDSVISEADCVELGLSCAGVCEALKRGMEKEAGGQLSRSVLKAIEKLTATIAEIQKNAVKRGKRNPISRRYHVKDDKKAVAAWKLELDRILHVFDTELGISANATASGSHEGPANNPTVPPDIRRNKSKSHALGSQNQPTHASAPGESPPPSHGTTSGVHRDVVSEVQTMVSDVRRMLKHHEKADGQPQLTQHKPGTQYFPSPSAVFGELPPLPPRIFFGRNELIEQIVGLAQSLTPIALIGSGGIGKTSIVLALLDDERIKQRFGDNRSFIRCDQFPTSHTHLLRRLSKVIGADVENPEDLAALRRYLFSKEMVIVLDNAESILDPRGADSQEIYEIVDELTRFSNVCLCLTSRISTIPPSCETLEIPTLSMEAAHDTFYRIYKHGGRCDSINNILEQLDFHPLSVTLLATVAQYNKWNPNRLTREWERKRTGVLHAQHSESLAATIELSLTSPMFRELGPDARALLEVVAFFPQGVDEENVDWLFSTVSDAPGMLDTFCALSLTYRSNGSIMMLAPLRDHLRPKDPISSPLLSVVKEHYFVRLSTDINPDEPNFEELLWITSEDVNVEHLLDIFTSLDPGSEIVWDACAGFLYHLNFRKPRLTTLGPKVETLSDNHPSKAQCLCALAFLFTSVGNYVESKRLHTYALKLWRERGDVRQVARILSYLSDANRLLDLGKEAIEQAREASEIFKQLGDAVPQAKCLIDLAWALYEYNQIADAEEAALRAIDLLPEDQRHQVCQAHRVLGDICSFSGDIEEAEYHFEIAFGIAAFIDSPYDLFWIHYSVAQMFAEQSTFDDAHDHIESARSYANDAYSLGRAVELQADVWFKQGIFKKAKFEASRAVDIYMKVGATRDIERCRVLLGKINESDLGDLGQGTE